MSYDLSVATHERPDISAEEQRAAVPFHIDGPFQVEIADLPQSLAQAVLAPSWLVEISVPAGAPAAARSKALVYAKKLATAHRGGVFDPQEDRVVWPRSSSRTYARSSVKERVDVVSLQLIFRHSKRSSETALELLRLLRLHCPEALPQRFGVFEPLQGRLDRDGDKGFAGEWSEVASSPSPLFFWNGSLPCYEGSASLVGPETDVRRPVQIHLSFDGRALRDPGWREVVVRLFTAVADGLGATAGAALVDRDWLAERGRLWSDNRTRSESLDVRGEWRGWRPLPAWLLWFGLQYVDRMSSTLAVLVAEQTASGAVVRLSQDFDDPGVKWPDLPPDICCTQATLSVHGRSAVTWQPAAWLPTLGD